MPCATSARTSGRLSGMLEGAHGIAPEMEQQLRAEVGLWSLLRSGLVPAHGDWQPRISAVSRLSLTMTGTPWSVPASG